MITPSRPCVVEGLHHLVYTVCLSVFLHFAKAAGCYMHFTKACVAPASTGEMQMSWSDLLVAICDEMIHTPCVETCSDA